eukprot:1141882-Prorocentrum_minimum.AAC.1
MLFPSAAIGGIVPGRAAARGGLGSRGAPEADRLRPPSASARPPGLLPEHPALATGGGPLCQRPPRAGGIPIPPHRAAVHRGKPSPGWK